MAQAGRSPPNPHLSFPPPAAQGFCCPCSAGEAWQQTVMGGAIATSRGNLNCNLFAQNLFLTGVPATARAATTTTRRALSAQHASRCASHPGAHPPLRPPLLHQASCLRFDPQWYSGYAIGAASYDFLLTVTLSQGPSAVLPPSSSSSGASQQNTPPPPPPQQQLSETVTVSPAELRGLNGARSVLVELLGDLGGFSETPVLSSSMLFMPFFANGSTGDSREWLVIDKTRVRRRVARLCPPHTPTHAFTAGPRRRD